MLIFCNGPMPKWESQEARVTWIVLRYSFKLASSHVIQHSLLQWTIQLDFWFSASILRKQIWTIFITISIQQDKSLADGIFFLELLSAVQPRAVNWSLVTKGVTGMFSSNHTRCAVTLIGNSSMLWQEFSFWQYNLFYCVWFINLAFFLQSFRFS